MDDATCTVVRLPDAVDGVRQPFESVADSDAHVLDAAVLQARSAPGAKTCALAAVAEPQAQDVAFLVHSDTDHHIDRLVADKIASMKMTGYTSSSGRFIQAVISSSTWSVILEIVSFDTEAP